MKLIKSIVLTGSLVGAVSAPGFALAASSDSVIRPQTLQTPVIQIGSQQSNSQPSLPISLNINQVIASSAKNSKNCGNGNNDQTGNSQNNGNCSASK